MKKGPSIRTDQSGAEKGTRQEMTHSIKIVFTQSVSSEENEKNGKSYVGDIVMLVTYGC